MRFPRLALLALCALYLVHRFLLLHTNFDAAAIPNYELHPMGNIGENLRLGWRGAPLAQNFDNCGGHLIVGSFAGVLFQLFGSSYLVLKLVPLLLGLGCIPLLVSIGSRLFGGMAGWLAALLFVVGPPTLVKYSVLAFGSHFEGIFFQLLLFWMFLRMHASGHVWGWVPWVALVAGFSIFFYFGSFLLVSLLVLTHLLIRCDWGHGIASLRKPAIDVAFGVAPFVIGLSPFVWLKVGVNRPSSFLGDLWSENRLAELTDKVRDLFVRLLPGAGCYPDLGGVSGRWAAWIGWAVFALAWAVGTFVLLRGLRGLTRSLGSRGESQRAEQLRFLPLVGYLPLFVLAYGLSTNALQFREYFPPVEVGTYRYLLTHFSLATLLIAGAVLWLWRQRSSAVRALGGAMGTCAVALGAFSLPMIDWSFAHTGLGSGYPGYYWKFYNNTLLRDALHLEPDGQLSADYANLSRQLGDFEPPRRHTIAMGIGNYLAFVQNFLALTNSGDRPGGQPFRLDLEALLATNGDATLHPDLVRGAGSYLRRPMIGSQHDLGGLRAYLEDNLTSPWAGELVEGLCLENDFPLARNAAANWDWTVRLSEAVPAPLMPAYRRGQGMQLAELIQHVPSTTTDWMDARIASIPKAEQPDFWRGMGFGLASSVFRPTGLKPYEKFWDDSQVVWVREGLALGQDHVQSGD
ncbi:MAG TPA: hypothetical protein P5218_10040 [Planctomycetota bacterium]|nr:hypothetical protein [Planctomycetota bacterium]